MLLNRILLLVSLLSISFLAKAQLDCDGGTVSTIEGDSIVTTTAGDGEPDLIAFASAGADTSSSFIYVVTDDNNVILALPDTNVVDFEGAGEGVCRLWGLSFTGNIIAQAGDTASAVALTDSCFDLSDNFVTIIREGVDTTAISVAGGTVTTVDGETEVEVCVGDGVPDEIAFASEGADTTANFTFVVTDDSNVILGVPGGNVVDFEGAGPGVCRLWGLSFTGEIIAQAGDTASAVDLSDGAFALSDNFVIINRISVNGGTVTTVDGETEVSTVAGDGQPDSIAFAIEGADTTANFTYVVTDDANVILAVPDGNVVDFEGAGPGVCRVWGLSFTGNIIAQAGDTASVVALSDACFDLSDNFVIVNRLDTTTNDTTTTDVEGGTVTTVDGETEVDVCAGDGMPDEIAFASEGADTTANFTFVVTDDSNVILGVPGGNVVDFEGAGPGVCRLWGLSFTGEIIAEVGDTASSVPLSNGAFDLSDNFVIINRTSVGGGTVSTIDGEVEVDVCLTDTIPDILSFASEGADTTANFTYVVTDDNNVILAVPDGNMVDFAPAGVGVCRVWGLSFTGNIIAQAGDTASAVALSDECFALSDNFVSVDRIEDCDTVEVPPTGGVAITGFVLVNSNNDTDIMMIEDGDVININTLPVPEINIKAMESSEEVESVLFTVNGNFYTIENIVPYALGGDSEGDFNATPFLQVGVYELTATPYTEDGTEGEEGTSLTITFELINGEPADMSLAITGFTLVDAEDDSSISDLTSGDVISSEDAMSASIVANTEGEVESVVFTLNGSIFNIENAAPFALAGDIEGDFFPFDLPEGEHVLTATPYSEDGGQGEEGQSLTITFTVGGETSSIQAIGITPVARRIDPNAVVDIFPNPAIKDVTIMAEKEMEERIEISVMTLNGNIVMQKVINGLSSNKGMKLDLNELPQGVYIMRLSNENFVEIKRILKQ